MVRVNQIQNEIARQLTLYTAAIERNIEDIKEEVSDDTVALLKQNSPKHTGAYAKGWTKKAVGKNIVVHNKTNPGLTHLLERGHVNKDGGRTQAEPHIKPIEERAISAFTDKLIRRIES